MTGLAEKLGDPVVPGAYRWRGADVGPTVEAAGWRFAHLDGAGVDSVQAMHEALAMALDFPDYYGHNLDALHDCLRDVSPRTVLLWDHWAPIALAEPRVFATAVELLGDRITLLLPGDGPDTDLPDLT